MGGSSHGLPTPEVALADLRSGGPPPDGIPSIDRPEFIAATEVNDLADEEPVLALEIDGDARAYPVQILLWHEIVNDVVGGRPVAVTYCPLCNSAVAYERRIGGRMVDFGTSGLLWNSALVMYDRQTETLWSHFTGRGIAGELTGVELDTHPVATVPWGAWRDAHPDGVVLSRDTGHARDYGSNPYPGYDDIASQPFLFEGEVDGRLTAMTRVVGIVTAHGPTAIPLVELVDQRVINLRVLGSSVAVWWTAGLSSPLDAPLVADGEDIGSTAVFSTIVEGRQVTLEAHDDGIIDQETGSSWNQFGRATAGPLAGTQLQPLVHLDTFWFAWSAFQPATTLTLAGEE
jgi:hypothetical protein